MRTIRLVVLSVAAASAALVGVAPAATGAPKATGAAAVIGAPAVRPTFTPLGPVNANALSMSADGSVVVGVSIFGDGAFRWSQQSGTESLGAASGQISISRDGDTIVADVDRGGHRTAAKWTGGTRWKSLGGYPGSDGCPDLSNAFAVSDTGSVVGLGWADCSASAFRWDRATSMVSLGSLDGAASRANDISADGAVIVGWDDAPDGMRRGAMWVNGAERLLSRGRFLGSAEAVSSDGSVIVGGGAGYHGKQAYRWTKKTGPQFLGKLPGGGVLASASALATTDDGNIVVGFSGAADRDAFVWTPATGMFKLQDYLVGLGVKGLTGWRLDTALAVSRDGTTIAGWGIRPDGQVQSWVVTNLPPFAAAG